MWDIYLGIVIIIAVSAVLFLVGVKASRSLPAVASSLLAVASVVFILGFWQLLYGQLTLTKLLPFSNVIVTGNWIPPGAALLAGILWGKRKLKPLRRGITCVLLCFVALYCLVESLVGQTPPVRYRWTREGICIQTSQASCSACSAATLLRYHGIPASEAEMAALCLTRSRGTRPLGLYRGLKIKTRNTRWRVEAFKTDLEGLRSMLTTPVIVSVGPEPNADVEPRYERELGWRPGLAHSVVLYGFTSLGRIRVADPKAGYQIWRAEVLEVWWHGTGLRLVERDSP